MEVDQRNLGVQNQIRAIHGQSNFWLSWDRLYVLYGGSLSKIP